MRLEYRTNNAYDSVILVDDKGMVRSDWTVVSGVLKDFCDCSQDAADWDDRFGSEHTADEYGELVAVRTGYQLQAVDIEKWESCVATVLH